MRKSEPENVTFDRARRITNEQSAGIALMDHPANPNHPAPFHVRDNGWMGVCLTLDAPVTITPAEPVRLPYGQWIHPAVPDAQRLDRQWQTFASSKMASMATTPRKE